MTMISDLPQDVLEEILSRVPITSLRAVRSTSKRWNGLSKEPSFTKKLSAKEKEFMMIMMNGSQVCLMSVNRHNHKDLVDASIKRIGEFNQVEIFSVFQCDGLLLCLTDERNARLVVWNPYLGQTRWIEPRTTYEKSDWFGIGYNNNNNHKILRFFLDPGDNVKQEIYELKSNSWRVLTTSLNILHHNKQSVSLKGNTYFFIKVEDPVLVCYDFTREIFGPPIHMPFIDKRNTERVLSTVREEQLAMLCHRKETSNIEIWITNQIESNAVSWSRILAFDTNTIFKFEFEVEAKGIFFIDEEKKMAMICGINAYEPTMTRWLYKAACIIGEDGYFKAVDLREAVILDESLFGCPTVCSHYVPSLVQISKPSSGGNYWAT